MWGFLLKVSTLLKAPLYRISTGGTVFYQFFIWENGITYLFLQLSAKTSW